jgi:hypothetical protein
MGEELRLVRNEVNHVLRHCLAQCGHSSTFRDRVRRQLIPIMFKYKSELSLRSMHLVNMRAVAPVYVYPLGLWHPDAHWSQ